MNTGQNTELVSVEIAEMLLFIVSSANFNLTHINDQKTETLPVDGNADADSDNIVIFGVCKCIILL